MNLLKQLLGAHPAPHPLVTLGGIALPASHETLHGLLVGSTGTGKTTLLDEVLPLVIDRGDRCIVLDANGHTLSRFYRSQDEVLNPFDRRSPGWSLFNEVRRDWDYDRLARSVIPDGYGADASWHGYAQVFLAEVLRMLMRRGENNTQALLYWATIAPVEELHKALADTAAAGLFDPNAAKALASVRFILTSHLRPQQYLLPGDFSLRDWLHSGQGNLYITWRSDMLASLRPLVACWVDVLLAEVLSLAPSPTRRLWVFLDELGALGKLSSLEAALTMGRKFGVCVWAGLQSTSQLDRLYGRENAIVLRSCFRNLAVFGVARSDPDTAETMSRALGEREVDREQVSVSQGMQGTSQSASVRRVKERLVLPSEICELPDLDAYLALAGDAPVRRIRACPRGWPVVVPALEEVGTC